MGSKLSWIIDNLVNKKYLTVYTVVTLVEESTEQTQKSLSPHAHTRFLIENIFRNQGSDIKQEVELIQKPIVRTHFSHENV